MQGLSELTVTFILNAGWQIAAIFAVAALASWLLKNGPARYRHTLWIVALAASFVVPLLTATRLVPTWEYTREAVPTVRSSTVPKAEPRAAQDFKEAPAIAQLTTRRTTSIATTTETTLVVAILYAFVLLGGIIRLARFWRRKEKLRRSASTIALTAEIYDVVQRCRNVFTLSNVQVARSNQARVPYTLGARRPLIILPEAFCSGAGEARLLSVIGHEMAHVARRDFLTNFICELVALPISFHPLTFLVKREIERTRELACDELVTTRLLPPRVYARSLLWAAAVSRQYTSRALMLSIFDGKILEERIMRLTKNSSSIGAGPARVVMYAALLVLCASAISLPMFSLELQTQVHAELMQSLQMLNPPVAQNPVAPAVTTSSQDPEPQLNAPAPENRSTSACAAGRRGDVSAIAALIGLLGDDTKTPLVKCWDSGRWSPALQTFKHPSPGEQAAIALASFGRPAFGPLVNQLNSSNATVRRNAAWAIGELTNMLPGQRSSAVPSLISLLTDADEWVRMAAARALGELRDERAVDQLVAVLGDNNWQVRQVAVWALSELKDERAVNSLCNVLLTDIHPEVRRGAAEALGEIRSAEALPSLKQALNDNGTGVRAKVAWAISEIEG